MITVVLELNQEIEREARSRGLLSSENIVLLIEKELREQKRKEAIQQTRTILDQLDALEPKLSEAEIEDELNNPSTN